MTDWRVIEGDCIAAMADMDASSIDAIVCDPPYGLGFMGREWDSLPPGLPWARECLRVLRPGGHLLAFGGTRTYHRLTCALEDGGFEIRDCLAWLYGSGFPKSLDVSKAIDKAAGAERDVVAIGSDGARRKPRAMAPGGAVREAVQTMSDPATPDAQQWNGWGTALKPAHEPIVMARKSLTGTVAANVLEHGCGALNVDGCRIEGQPRTTHADGNHQGSAPHPMDWGEHNGYADAGASGRWPANVLLDPEAAELLDAQTGNVRSAGEYVKGNGVQGEKVGAASIPIDGLTSATYADAGGASRFFYVAKASNGERNAGLDEFEEGETRTYGDLGPDENARPNGQGTIHRANVHPTVKPIDLMRWLCRLVTPPGGTVLDPFTGSGTTGCAAVLEDFDFIGIEREAEYAAIARARIAHWWGQPVQLGLEAA